ncbi:2OG-Fe(II) oxygenase [Micromonospora echinofusca]|uniref:2OG-Fe(II) oxygenase n=1 Tax=Micromonospora echinofusca TaxID=47858 RepID=UPI003405B979
MTAVASALLSLHGAEPQQEPFPWYQLNGTFGAPLADELEATFPADGFAAVSRPDGEKSYEMWVRQLCPPVPEATTDLPPAWAALTRYVTSPTFAAAVGELTGLPVADAAVEVNLWRYTAGCWLAPHLDKPEKIVTVVCYLNRDWPTGEGGELLLLNSARADDVARRVAPLLDTGVILVRGNRSWHAVDGMRDNPRERRSVQVVFNRPVREAAC